MYMQVKDAAAWPRDKISVIDVETTGLRNDYDEILSLAIVDGDGNVLFYEMFKPERRKSWKAAEKINGISPADVKNARGIKDAREEIEKLLVKDRLIVAYNLWFDVEFLRSAGISVPAHNHFDVMADYSEVYGQIGDDGEHRNVKLVNAAKKYKYVYKAHDAVEDAKATAHVFRSLLEDPNYKAACDEMDASRERCSRMITEELERKKKEEEDRKEPGAKVGCLIGIVLLVLFLAFVFWISK